MRFLPGQLSTCAGEICGISKTRNIRATERFSQSWRLAYLTAIDVLRVSFSYFLDATPTKKEHTTKGLRARAILEGMENDTSFQYW